MRTEVRKPLVLRQLKRSSRARVCLVKKSGESRKDRGCRWKCSSSAKLPKRSGGTCDYVVTSLYASSLVAQAITPHTVNAV